MTLQEAFEKALTIGKHVSITASLQTSEVCDQLEYYSINIDGIHVVCCSSYEDAFSKIAKLDPAAEKARKVATLRRQIEELES